MKQSTQLYYATKAFIEIYDKVHGEPKKGKFPEYWELREVLKKFSTRRKPVGEKNLYVKYINNKTLYERLLLCQIILSCWDCICSFKDKRGEIYECKNPAFVGEVITIVFSFNHEGSILNIMLKRCGKHVTGNECNAIYVRARRLALRQCS